MASTAVMVALLPLVAGLGPSESMVALAEGRSADPPRMPVPALAFGTGDTHCRPDCASAVAQALQLGFRNVDTAYEYGSQSAVGEGLRRSGVPRSEVFLATKIPGPVGAARAEVLLRQALRELNVSQLDLLLMHYPCSEAWPDPRDACSGNESAGVRLETWRAMERLRGSGLVRHIGVSNYHIRHLESLLGSGSDVSVPFVNQVEWHLGWHDEALLNYSRQRGILLQAYSPLGGGGTTTGHNGGVALDDPAIERIARRHNVSTAQVALRWSLDKGVAIVTSTTSAAHVTADLAVLNFSLLPSEVATLSSLRAEVPSVQILDSWPDVTMPVVALSAQGSSGVGSAVSAWLRLGGRNVDTAPARGTEGEVGDALDAAISGGVVARDEIFLTAKLPGPVGRAAAHEVFHAEMLTALRVEYVDLLLIGWPCPGAAFRDDCTAEVGAAAVAETWQALEELQAAGKVRSIGVANFHQGHLERMLPHVRNISGSNTSAVAVNQVEWHLGWHDEGLLEYCRQHGIRLQAHSPLGGEGAAHPGLPLSSERLLAVARAHNTTATQVALRWSVQRGVPVVVPTGSNTSMAQELSPLFGFTLSEAELSSLGALGTSSSEGLRGELGMAVLV